MYLQRIDKERVELAARTEVCRYMSRLAAVAEYLAKRAMMRGVTLAVSYERTVFGKSVHVWVSFRLLHSTLDEKETVKYVVTRARALEKVLNFLKRELEKHGIHCEVRSRVTTGPGPEVLAATMVAEFVVVDVDVNKILSKPYLRWIVFGGTDTTVGMMPAGDIKAVEAETLIEYERGGETVPAEEDLRDSAEGGGEEEPAGAGLDLIGPREAAEGGYLRLSEAALRYGVPLGVLMRLVLEGRIEYRYGVDSKGAPAMYVKEEEVREVARYFKSGTEKEGEGGGGGG
jgi:nucleotide-binding universal stress UspA family protein